MSRQFEGQTDVILQLAVAMLRKRRDEVGAQLDQVVNQMLSRALREDRDSIQRQLLKAEALEIQARYEESIATYDKILERDDVPATVRAVAMNNLGFQLALNNERLDEAHQLVDEAMKTFGPVSDMLDTRAMVCLARNEYDLAVEDMELALSISKDPVKYFHLAKVHMGAGNGPAALRAWDQALANGFKKEALMSVEQENFDEIKAQIENLRSQNDRL